MSARSELEQAWIDRLTAIKIKVRNFINDIRSDLELPLDVFASPEFDSIPTSVVVPSVFASLTHEEAGAIIYYDLVDQVPANLYSAPIRLNLASAVSQTVPLYAKATDSEELLESARVTKTYTSSVAWDHVWNLDTNVNDSKGSVNFTNTGGVTFASNTATFNGTAVLSTTDTATMLDASFTMSCWAKITAVSNVSNYCALWGFEEIASGSDGGGIIILSDGTVFAQLLQSNGTYVTAQTSPGAVTFGSTYYHFVFVADGTNVKVYLDGSEILSVAYDNTIQSAKFERLVVGGELTAGGGAVLRGIQGSIDRLYYLTAPLTSGQVAELYEQDLLHTKL